MAHAISSTSAHEDWFQEPTEPADKKYSVWLILFQFFFFIALLGPAIVGIGVKVTALQEAGAHAVALVNHGLVVDNSHRATARQHHANTAAGASPYC